MIEIYGDSFSNRYGPVGGSGWETWAKALSNVDIKMIAKAIESILTNPSKYPPNLPEFLDRCGLSRERQLGMQSKEISFPLLMNVVCSSDKRKMNELNPGLYWIYRHLDLFSWRRMDAREARKVFNSMYEQALQASDDELIDPPVLLDDPEEMAARERRAKSKTPEYKSRRKKAADSAMSDIRKRMSGNM